MRPVNGGVRFNLRKMRVDAASTVRYVLDAGDEPVAMHQLLGGRVVLRFSGVIHCVACGRRTNKSFSQGYCFQCFRSLPSCDRCIVSPELCHYAAGTCRDPEWGLRTCFAPHVVYLANSSGLKVGITRSTQTPTRWIDQGARAALPIVTVPDRLASGRVESAMKQHVADKTNWRAMLKGDPPGVDLHEARDKLLAECRDALAQVPGAVAVDDAEVLTLRYPVSRYPDKVRALTAEKMPEVSGRLDGIKGQYLLLDTGVFNVRRHTGYECTMWVENEAFASRSATC
ncbi:MAG: DUF2797 domain-containing protein [Pseudomonadota bacterium]